MRSSQAPGFQRQYQHCWIFWGHVDEWFVQLLEMAYCYIRAISFCLFGTQDNHLEVRTLLIRFENLNKNVFEGRLIPGVNESTVMAHVKKLCRPFTWAANIEMMATATLFQVPVYECTQAPSGFYRWEIFKPLQISNYQFKHPEVPFTWRTPPCSIHTTTFRDFLHAEPSLWLRGDSGSWKHVQTHHRFVEHHLQ